MTHRNWLAILLAGSLGLAVPAAAQTSTDPLVWAAVSVQGKMDSDSPWRWSADSLVRTRNGGSAPEFMGEWFTVTRDLTRRSSVGVGYAFGASFPDSGSRREQRLVQQYTWTAGAAWRLSLKTQVEERFVSGDEGMSVRVRQLIRTTWPLAEKGTLRGVLSAEVLARANSTARAARGFDSSQVFLGIAKPLTTTSRVEVGYVNVYSPGLRVGRRHGHAMSVTLFVSQ